MQGEAHALKTCIIGAGCAGLATARALLAAGLDIDVFETQSDIGGNWAFGVYDATYLISSRNTSSFTEFPMPEEYPDFPSRVQMREYLQAYAKHFDLRRHISIGQKVTSVWYTTEPHSWQVTTSSGVTQNYDSVVVANGHVWDEVIPACAGSFRANKCIRAITATCRIFRDDVFWLSAQVIPGAIW